LADVASDTPGATEPNRRWLARLARRYGSRLAIDLNGALGLDAQHLAPDHASLERAPPDPACVPVSSAIDRVARLDHLLSGRHLSLVDDDRTMRHDERGYQDVILVPRYKFIVCIEIADARARSTSWKSSGERCNRSPVNGLERGMHPTDQGNTGGIPLSVRFRAAPG
jgi:hypothetical protein